MWEKFDYQQGYLEHQTSIAMEILYDVPIEVTQEQYKRITDGRFGMIVAHRRDHQSFWIKLWVMSYKDALEKELNK